MKKPTVSVVMIVKNEEVLLGRCLESVKEADEIIICDTGSIDNTIEVAKKYTDKVYTDFIWCDDFSKAQNHAKSKATGDWILSIDADEFLHDFSEVRKAIEIAKDTVAVHMIAEGGGVLNFDFARLFRNTPEIYWVQPIHKHLNVPGAGEKIGNVTITFGWSPAHERDPDRALRVLERMVKQEGDNALRNLYYLGREYWYKGRLEECTATLGKYVQVAYWDAEKAESFLIMSQAYSRQGHDEDARIACAHAILTNPNFKEAIEWMAGICLPEHASQWKQLAKTATNEGILFDRSPAEKYNARTIFLAPEGGDETLYGSLTLLRYKPLVMVCGEAKQATIKAMEVLGCPVVFLGIKDLTEEKLKERLRHLNPDTVYAPVVDNESPNHKIVGKVALELFGKKIERYSDCSNTGLLIKNSWELIPTDEEKELKDKALSCYGLVSKSKSEWLV